MVPLRVLHVGHSYVVRLNRGVSAALSRLPGTDVTVIAPSFFHGDLRPLELEPDPQPAAYTLLPVPTHLSQRIHVFWYAWKQLSELIRGGRFDIVFAWQEPYILAGYQIARAVGPTPSRLCFRTAQSLVKRYPPPFSYFERSVGARAQGWVAGGELVRRAMERKGFQPAVGRVFPLGVDLSEFHPLSEVEKAQVRQELELEGPIIGYLGRLVPQKGIRVLLRALEQLRGSWSAVFLGSGPLKREIEAWARRTGLTRRIRVLLARHSDVPRYVGAFDVLAAPSQTTRSWMEQFGRMVPEAFACRVPVLTSTSGELPFVVGDAGRVLPEEDPTAWAEALGALLDSPARRAELAEAGYQRCRARFSCDSVAQSHLAFYRELMDLPLKGCLG